MLEQGEMKRAV